MTIEREVTFHGIEHQSAIDTLIDERIDHLPHFYERVTRIRVVVDVPHRSHRGHNPYAVKLEISVASQPPIVVERTPEDPDQAPEAVVRDVFDVAERQLRKLHDRRVYEHRHP